ncbi:hypothetical protein VIN30_00320 [Adlercreutzia sp. R7]|uniref:Uncharacterized protein n=1 Tax=Adlercreutzia wanghongyangiae TaxID=3111451 RepID=A0ABU6IEN9_9ACTN|nr:hypothetical protein [Adlercreutzia sp. R7]
MVRDAAGNSTTVRLTYHLVASHVPGVIVTPDPGTDLVPRPGDDPLNPKPRPVDPSYPPEVAPDGTQHAVIDDAMRVKVQQGKTLTLADARSLMLRRYSFTPEGGGAMAELSLALADAKGSPVPAVDLSHPGSWLITWKVADQSGNTVTIRLRYLVTSDAPTVTPDGPGDGSGGDGSGGVIGGNPPEVPITPTSTDFDPETGLTHSVVEDHVIVGTTETPLTAQAMASFIDARYRIAAAMGGNVTAGDVRLTDAYGAAVASIDRSVPGTWHAEQVFTDEYGNTTTLRLTYEVREGAVQGGISDGNGSSGADSGGVSVSEAGPVTGSGNGDGRNRWASAIHQLPQTGGILGPCPLHIMFVLIMVLASAYTLMRLRQESNKREDRRGACNAPGEESCHEPVR